MQRVKENLGSELTINWRYFSLEQVNSQAGPDWKLWEQFEDYPSRGLFAFWAAEAARSQGEDAFNRFHSELLKARHEERKNIAERSTLIDVARSIDLDMARFESDLGDRKLLTKLAQDYTSAVETLGVFGTPTLVFAEEQAVFLKMSPAPPPEESLSFFTELSQLAEQRPYIQEIKRP